MSWMHTFTGKKFHVLTPKDTTFDIEDIAHALANICRFGGHTRHFYSVAEHSMMVADIVKSLGGSPLEQLWGLMHDATEAYMGDIPTPLKATLEGFSARENALMLLIGNKFLPEHGEPSILPAIVKSADRIALVTEARQLMRGTGDWGPEYDTVPSHPVNIEPYGLPGAASVAFLKKYKALVKLINKT